MRCVLISVVLLAFAGCRCEPPVMAIAPANVRVAPESVRFEQTYVGARRAEIITFTNSGGASADLSLMIAAPFSIDVTSFTLARGDDQRVTISFVPTVPGHFEATLEGVAISGDALEVPMCTASSVCHAAQFELEGAQCVERPSDDGTACTTRCISGSCQSATCVGAIIGCDDHDACTIDACSEEDGCAHPPVVCPVATSPCQIASCDSQSGCGFVDADDGVLCGVDDCLSTSISVCITGQCVARARPAQARCSNRWLAADAPARRSSNTAWDPVRNEALIFGGSTLGTTNRLGDTWSWNGQRWLQLLPPASPSPRSFHAMATDLRRKRIVLFGGGNVVVNDETWEWDGTTWLQRHPVSSPPARGLAVLVWNPRTSRTLLFGGFSGPTRFSDLWEWDGTRWRELVTVHHPDLSSGSASAVMDEARGRLVVFVYPVGGVDPFVVWEFDGVDWERMPSSGGPSPRGTPLTFWDGTSQRIVMSGGSNAGILSDTWSWNGSQWTLLTTIGPARAGHTAAWDPTRRRAVFFGGMIGGGAERDTWEWDGSAWLMRSTARPGRSAMPIAYGASSVVAIGGFQNAVITNEHFEWNGTQWSLRPVTAPSALAVGLTEGPNGTLVTFGGAETRVFDGTSWALIQPTTIPPARAAPAMAFDRVRQRVVLFGGESRTDTWEWDGTTWVERMPVLAPSARTSARMMWDSNRERVVLFGGEDTNGLLSDLWEWDGVTWSLRSMSSSPAPSAIGSQLIYDPVRQRGFLFNNVDSSAPPQTWELDGTQWTQRQPTESPTPLFSALTWDPITQHMRVLNEGVWWVFLP